MFKIEDLFTTKILVANIEQPIKTKIIIPVTLCSITPINFGASPGTVDS